LFSKKFLIVEEEKKSLENSRTYLWHKYGCSLINDAPVSGAKISCIH